MDRICKVLWVDDDDRFANHMARLVPKYGIQMDFVSNWEEAEQKLSIGFKEYSAIILDAHCRLKKSDMVPSEKFLGEVVTKLCMLFGEKHEDIPWYILTAGTMTNLAGVIDVLYTDRRRDKDPYWGPLVYYKTAKPGYEELFEKIKEVSSDMSINKVLYRHSDVLKYLGEGNLIAFDDARFKILKMLSALYNPEENLNYEYPGNPLRKVLEYLFRTAHHYGLLPQEFIVHDGPIENLQDCSRFLSGINPKHPIIKDCGFTYRFGTAGKEKDGSGGESVFNKSTAGLVRAILDFSNNDSHTKADEKYIVAEENKELFFGYVLQLCHVIKFLGHYIDQHSDRESNLKKHVKIYLNSSGSSKDASGTKKIFPPMESFIGKTGFLLCRDSRTALLGECCKLADYKPDYIGKKVRIVEVAPNTGSDASRVPYLITKFELL